MTRWVKQLWRRLRQEDVIETLAHDLDGARRVMHFDAGERGNLKKEIATLREQVRRLEAEPDRLAQMLARRTQERDAAQMKLNAYLDGVPATHAEMSWTKEDQAQLADFLEHKPAGKKLAQHLANRVQD